ncbi:MAG TPA: hypothetical protein VIP11_18355 [Gemmatimonadaceae bacterium]
MRVLCVARHPILSEHLGRFFQQLGVETVPCVGLREAMELVPRHDADAVICDYDLLASMAPALASWEENPVLARTPIIAVSLTRQMDETLWLEGGVVAGFFYLPTLAPDDARRMLAAVRRARGAINPPPDALQWPGSTSVARRS